MYKEILRTTINLTSNNKKNIETTETIRNKIYRESFKRNIRLDNVEKVL